MATQAMPAPQTQFEESERLLLLTLLLEAALVEDDFVEANRLFAMREQIIATKPALTLEQFKQIQNVDARALARLRESTVGVAKELFTAMEAQRAVRVYRNPQSHSGYDLAG